LRNESTNDTSNVTRGKSDTKLSALSVTAAWLGEDVTVEEFDNLFEEIELSHCVRDLARPERDDTAEGETINLAARSKSGTEGCGEASWGRGLNLDLHHFHRAKGNISEELCGCRSGEVDDSTVGVHVILSREVRVKVFEHLVETELAETLH